MTIIWYSVKIKTGIGYTDNTLT
uniref:Uncharacterized protein n=1 Tax=Arundo donax TaxID=35708 RepID=A0A0A9PUY5_ARUDO